MRKRLLDLFCGAGGCAAGYAAAGFEVIGVDSVPQPRYPFHFIQADALEFPLNGFDVVHASPPCQHYSITSALWQREYADLVPLVRSRLWASGKPFVIENVIGAPLPGSIVLCGTMFGLGCCVTACLSPISCCLRLRRVSTRARSKKGNM